MDKIIIKESSSNLNVKQVGSPGATGPSGESAYQVWLDLGNSGTEQDFINSLVGPKGDAGSNGTNGSDGLSAYQVWINLGNTGTEQDFINSLKGAQGDKGDAGSNGQGVAIGGTTGQVLTKNSNTDYDTSWTTIQSNASTYANKNIRFAVSKGSGLTTNSGSFITVGTTGNSFNGNIATQMQYTSGKEGYYATPRNSFQIPDNPTTLSTTSNATWTSLDFAIGTSAVGGFKQTFVVGLGSNTDTKSKVFVGLCANFVGGPSFASGISQAANIIGFGFDTNDSTWHFISNDNAGGTASSVDVATFTGNLQASDYAARTIENRYQCDFEILAGDNKITATFTNLETKRSATAVLTGLKLPAYNTFLKPLFQYTAGTAGLAKVDILDVYRWYAESDY